MATREDDIRKPLCEMLRAQKDEIIERWLERVQSQHGRHDLSRTELLDSIPAYLDGLSELLAEEDPSFLSGEDLWETVAREHAIQRAEHGFDIEELVREFSELRQVLVEITREHELQTADVIDAITSALEIAITQSVGTYVAWRDEQSHRAELEHVSFITHELRNPLNTARMALDQLQTSAAITSEQKRLTVIIERSHQKLEELINSVLMLERGESGELEARPVVARLGPLLEEAAAGAQQTALAKGLAFELRYEPELTLSYDPRLLASAVQNLVDNAVKYSDHGAVTVWTTASYGEVVIHVTDSCGGLSEEEQAKLFEAFRRGEHRSAPGTGIGLTIAKRAVEAQGGDIRVDSGDDGCHFCISLPRDRRPSDSDADSDTEQPSSGAA